MNPGDGAFYGPKIDIKLYDAIKRHHQCGTIQLDFQLPIRFNLSFRSDEVVKHEDTPKPKKENEKEKRKAKKEEALNAEKNGNIEETANTTEKIIVPTPESGKEILKRESFAKDEWDDEEFVWEEQPLKAGYKRPVIVHRAILGSCERQLAILVKHYAGKWPFWISPRQYVLCTVSDKFTEYAEKIYHKLKYEGYQVSLDK